ncbi:MAG: type I restriction endonuclease subunit R, partial [Calditrichaeota bacterium]|nr:type I restriction endonuclease subunit R [Calditrichota bacterium]
MNRYSEDTLVQQTTADYLDQQLKWDASVYAYNTEDYGPDSLLGRQSDREVVLTRYLRAALVKLNPELPEAAYDEALRQIVSTSAAQSLVAANREKYRLIRDGVPVKFRNRQEELEQKRLRVIDFDDPKNNHFLCVRELWVRGDLYRRRADIVGFVNGLPLIFMELKNLHKDIRAAYEKNYLDYLDTVPHLFHHNAIVVLANGIDAKLGGITSRFEHFREWKRLREEDPGAVEMETLLKGVCRRDNFLDLLENFIVFDDSSGETRKIIAHNHQFLGVNRAITSLEERKTRQGKLGVFWHTQGAGKSYSIVFFTRKVHRRLGGNFTFLILTDRVDLDTQIYKTFAGCGVVDHDRDPCRAASGPHLNALLGEHKAYIFSLIQKFNRRVEPEQPYSERDDVIVITDEAHRTQYGTLALNMRNALPNASYMGFTGTPLLAKDRATSREVFGGYIHTYKFSEGVADGVILDLVYEARDIDQRLTSQESVDEWFELVSKDLNDWQKAELKSHWGTLQNVLSSESRMRKVIQDIIRDFKRRRRLNDGSGNAILVASSIYEACKYYELFQKTPFKGKCAVVTSYNPQAQDVSREETGANTETDKQFIYNTYQDLLNDVEARPNMNKTEAYEEQAKTLFTREPANMKLLIVVDKLLTGFDAPPCTYLYIDKSMQDHGLFQAICRTNRL